MENSRKEHIKNIEELINEAKKCNLLEGNKYHEAIEHILSDYKRVLKENKKIDFKVINEYTEEELKDDYDEEEIKELNTKKININFKNISFEDIFALKAFIDKANYKKEYHFYNKNNNKYVFLIQ